MHRRLSLPGWTLVAHGDPDPSLPSLPQLQPHRGTAAVIAGSLEPHTVACESQRDAGWASNTWPVIKPQSVARGAQPSLKWLLAQMPGRLRGAQVACSGRPFRGTKIGRGGGILVVRFPCPLSSPSTTSCLRTKSPETQAGGGVVSALLCHRQRVRGGGGGSASETKDPNTMVSLLFPITSLCTKSNSSLFSSSSPHSGPRDWALLWAPAHKMFGLRLGEGASPAQGRTANRAGT